MFFKSAQCGKSDHDFCAKINIFPSNQVLLKKLLKSWFHGKFLSLIAFSFPHCDLRKLQTRLDFTEKNTLQLLQIKSYLFDREFQLEVIIFTLLVKKKKHRLFHFIILSCDTWHVTRLSQYCWLIYFVTKSLSNNFCHRTHDWFMLSQHS